MPKSKPNPIIEAQQNALQSILPALPHDGELHFKFMFGGQCAYFNGRVFALLFKLGLALKLSPEKREQLLAEGGQKLQFEDDGPVMKNYIVVPEKIWSNRDEFAPWASASVEYVLEQPSPKSRKKP